MRWLSNFICIILIVAGVYCGISFHHELTKSSYVNGEINIENEFRKESFFYSSTAVAFYPTGNGTYYEYSTELPAVDDIDATKKDYSFYFMGYEVLNADMDAGLIIAPISMNFYNPDGTLACRGKMTVKIEFLSGATTLKLSCANKSSADYFEQHFADFGLKLRLVENIGGE